MEGMFECDTPIGEPTDVAGMESRMLECWGICPPRLPIRFWILSRRRGPPRDRVRRGRGVGIARRWDTLRGSARNRRGRTATAADGPDAQSEPAQRVRETRKGASTAGVYGSPVPSSRPRFRVATSRGCADLYALPGGAWSSCATVRSRFRRPSRFNSVGGFGVEPNYFWSRRDTTCSRLRVADRDRRRHVYPNGRWRELAQLRQRVNVPVELQGVVREVPVFLWPQLTVSCVLGADFLREFEMSVTSAD